jgi:predicted extracellular nuclease
MLAGLLSLALILTLIAVTGPPAQAVSPDIVISQVYGGGGNSGAPYTNDFVELFNRGTTPISLSGWSIQYASATGTGNFGSNPVVPLSGSLAPGQYYLVQLSGGTNGVELPTADATGSIAMSASSGKVVVVNDTSGLACNGGSTSCNAADLAKIVDLVGYGSANFFEGSGAAPGLSNTTADLRLGDGCQDTDENAADFVTGAPTPRNTSSPLHLCGEPPANQPVTVSCGTGVTTFEGNAASTTVSATDADGTVVAIAITDISPALASGTITLSDLVPAGGVGDTATATVAVDGDVPPGAYAVTLTATNDDAEPQTGTCTLSVTVNEVLTIGKVQGEVTDDVDGLTFDSPYNGQYVTIQGVIYENALSRTSSGSNSYGFFIQNSISTADDNSLTSDGIFVYIGRYSTLRIRGGGYYTPKVGDEVILNGPISEYYHLTELSNPYLEMLVGSDVDLNAEVPTFDVNPPTDLADANRYWERHEGMRAEVPAGSLATSGRDVFASTLDGEAWFIRGDSAVAQRENPYARRVFRDPHPLDDIPEQLFDNGNGYRIVLGSMGIKATEGDNTVLIAPVRTFDSMAEAAVGGVYFSFSKYQIMVKDQLSLSQGVNPAENNPPEAFDRAREYSVVTFNMENLYDYRDDPFDGCDFTGNSGCPGVYPPFDYVPASDAAYQARLQEIAGQIVNDLHSPDVIMAQEAEDQDICTVTDETLTCGTTDNADGKPDTLQELATVIYSKDGPVYDAAYDRDGADDRGIVSAFLYRTDRVHLLPAQTDDPVLGSNPQVIYRSDALSYNTDVQNPKALNAVLPADVDTSTGVDGDNVFTRAPQVGLFRVWRDGMGASVFTDLYLIDNHFSSGPDTRVGQRTEQANYNAAIVAALQMVDPSAYVSVGGDLNVYPRPDDPFVPGNPLFPSDQLAGLYNQGLTNLWDRLVADVPASAYSYVYQGQAQTLDQMFATPSILGDLVKFRASHINSDFPSDYLDDGPRGTSDHDPQVARYMALTLHGLGALVRYYDASGDITGNNTTRILLDRLERAQRYKDAGQQQAYMAQLQAFINQVQGFAPEFVTQVAADVLVQEVMLLQTL